MNPKIVCIGGGTGLSTMLRGLKNEAVDLVAIVTVADNGGSSGDLRKDLNMLPPGDIRNCLVALAETEPVLSEVFNYRFDNGSLNGHNLGNLIIAGLSEITGNFGRAVEIAHEVLRVKGRVLPVTEANVQLKAIYDDDSQIVGECEIVAANKSHKKHIKTMELLPKQPEVYKHVLEEIASADLLLLGPGSLYTSIVPNLLVDGVCEAIRIARADKVYISNIMTQPGETEGFTLLEHVYVIEEYLGQGVIDHILANDAWPDYLTISHYEEDKAQLILPTQADPRIKAAPMIIVDEESGYVRHDAAVLSQRIMALLNNKEN